MRLEESEALGERGQHAERQHVDLEKAERVEVVLVPFDDGAVLHRGVHDRHDLVEPVAGDDEAAAVLGQMARKAGELVRHLKRQRERRIGRIEAGRARTAISPIGVGSVAPGRAVQRGDDVVGEAEDLGRLADRRAGAIGDHGGGEPGALAAVALVDVLDHLLAPLVLEIDVDVGRLVALGRDEALEQQIEARRIDLGDRRGRSRRRNWPPSRGPGRGCRASGRSARCRAR